MKDFSLSRSQRIAARDFATIFAARQRAGDRHLLLYAASNSSEKTRFGLSVSRKLGNAVRRTAIKRRLREAFRLSQHELPGGLDLVLIPQREAARSAGVADYRHSLVELAGRLARRIAVGKP
jgi:ribonuclease P protein component